MILIVTRGTAGDVIPFIGLAGALRARGNEVVVLTHCAYQSRCERIGVGFESLDAADEYRAFVGDGHLLDTPAGVAQFAQTHIFSRADRELSLLEQYRSEARVVITRHMSTIAAPLFCERDRIPQVSAFAFAAQANCFDLWVNLCRFALSQEINSCRKELGLAPVRDWGVWARMPTAFMACWPDWFASSNASWPAHTQHVGFLWCDNAETATTNFRGDKDMSYTSDDVLITGGTSGWRMAQEFYATTVSACSTLQKRGIVVCQNESCIPQPLPKNVISFDSLSFAAVMPHMSAVVHHGGSGTMIRAMVAGVPQVVLPFGADRPDNGMRIERLGLGIRLSPASWNARAVAAAIERACTDKTIATNVARVRESVVANARLEPACAQIERLSRSPRTCTAGGRYDLSSAEQPFVAGGSSAHAR